MEACIFVSFRGKFACLRTYSMSNGMDGLTREIFSVLARTAAVSEAATGSEAADVVDGNAAAPQSIPRLLLAEHLQSTSLVPSLGVCIVERAFGGMDDETGHISLAAFQAGLSHCCGQSPQSRLKRLFAILGAAAATRGEADHSSVGHIAAVLAAAYTLEMSAHAATKEPFVCAARRAALVACGGTPDEAGEAFASWAGDQLPSLDQVLAHHVEGLCDPFGERVARPGVSKDI